MATYTAAASVFGSCSFRSPHPRPGQGRSWPSSSAAGMGISGMSRPCRNRLVRHHRREAFAGASWPGGRVTTTLTHSQGSRPTLLRCRRGIKDNRAQSVVFGGCHPQGKQLRSALTAAGFSPAPWSAGMRSSPDPLSETARDGDVTITPAVSGRLLAGGSHPLGVYCGQAYDATAALILALRSAAPDASRAAVRDALQAVSFAGLTGPVSFDTFGDRAVVDAVHTCSVAGRGM